MTQNRKRFWSVLLVLCLMLTLIPYAPEQSAAAEQLYGVTTANGVNVRSKASTKATFLFKLDKGVVCPVLGKEKIDGITWYKVTAVDPEAPKSAAKTGFIHGDFFREMTAEEAASFTGTAKPAATAKADAPTSKATATPKPAVSGSTGTITNSGVNMRSGPAMNKPSMLKLDKGTKVEILSAPDVMDENHWFKVKYDNQTGYIRADFIKVSGATATAKPTATSKPAATPKSGTGTAGGSTDASYTHAKLILSSCHLRTSPGGDYNQSNDWEGRGSILPLAGKAVAKGGYTWYPVQKNNKTYYVRNDCVQLVNSSSPTAKPTATPKPTATSAPSVIGYVITTTGGCNLRSTIAGTVIRQVGKNRTLPYLLQPVKKDGYTWYYVEVDGTRGYLRSDVVKVTKSPSDSSKETATPKPTATPAPSTVIGHVTTTVGGCNLRSTIGGTVIRQVGKGRTLPYLLQPVQKSGYTWYYVEVDGTRGYLRSDVVKVVKNSDPAEEEKPAASTPAPDATGYVKTNASGVNLRKKAGYSDILGKISKNVVLPYYGTPTTVSKVTWYKVYDKKLGYGYLHGDYVNVVNSDGSATPAPANPSGGISTGGGKPEASYTTLKLGSTGTAVTNLTTELKRQGYFSGSVTSKYTSAVESAVKAFQKAKSLTVDGIAGPATQHALYGTVPVGAGSSSNLSMTLYPAEKIDWFKGGINSMWAKGSNYKVYDVKTGIVWWAHRWSGGYHVDAEPLTAADTARLCKCYGVSTAQQIADKNLYQRRPLLVTIGTRTFACSLYGVPHNYPEGDTISTNDFKGQVCIHFTNSWTHAGKKVDSGHTEAIQYAWEHAPNGHK